MMAPQQLRVGIVGLGVIGRTVAEALARGLPGLMLAAVSGRDPLALRERLVPIDGTVPILSLDALVGEVDVVFDGAVAASLPGIARAALKSGRTLVTMNSGALLAHAELFEMAVRFGGRIVVPSGGIAGLDGIRAAARGPIQSLTLVSRKPPQSLAGAPHVMEQGFDLSNLSAPLKVFEGNAIEAARAFPANANVAATLSLAGPGPERTTVEMWADPTITRITQFIHLLSRDCELKLEIYSNAMPDNPRTGSLTPLSAIAALEALAAPCRVGS